MQLIKECPNECYQNFNPIPGEGPHRPFYMFIGEAPGREEDEQKRPFVGSAGKILNKILFYIPVYRKDVYISNIVKCRPPNNRPPTSSEVEKCLPFLVDEIEQIKPKYLVALGSSASITLTGKDLTWRGNIVKSFFFGIPTLITFHPSYLQRGHWDEFSTIVHDITKLQNPPKEYPENYILEPSDEIISYYLFDRWIDTPVSIDIETTGKFVGGPNPFGDQIMGIGFCGEPGVAFSIHLSNFSTKRWVLIKKFLEGDTPKIFQKNQFDRFFLLLKQGIRVRNMVWDTYDAMNLIKSDSPRDLDFLRSIYTNIAPYKHQHRKPFDLPKEVLGRYNCLDCDTTLQVSINQRPYITGKLQILQKRTLTYNDIALDMQYRGVFIDKTKLAINYLKVGPKAEELKASFFKDFSIDLDSPQQVVHLLYDTLKIPPPPSAYKGKSLSVDEKVLTDLLKRIYTSQDREVLKKILEYREVAKELSTYIIGFYKLIQDDGRVHPEWNPTGTDTGRWSCHRPSMQIIPEHLRGPIVAPPGKKLLVGDFVQLELLVIAILSEDFDLAKAILSGRDIHEEVRQEMSKVVPTTRPVVKTLVFGTMYGLAPRTAASIYNLPLIIVETLQKMVTERFPKIVTYREKTMEKFKSKGILETPFGRIKYCKTIPEALNYPVQSCASEVAGRALEKLYNLGFNLNIYNHDEIVSEEDENIDRLEEFAYQFNHACPEFFKFFPVKVRESTTWKKEE